MTIQLGHSSFCTPPPRFSHGQYDQYCDRSPQFADPCRTKYGSKTTLLLYGGIGETHEIALKTKSQLEVIEGHIGKSKQASDRYTFQWEVSTDRTIVQVESLTIYLLDRNSAYNYWVLDLPAKGDSRYSTSEPVVVKGGYLLRTAELDGNDLHLSGDINSTTSFEVISAPKRIENVMFNGKRISQVHEDRNTGIVSGVVKFEAPKPVIPSLSAVHWRAVDSLPEIYPSYDDSKWTKANHTYTNNTETRNLTTPTSLYSSDYGYNGGSLIYRGHFTAHGNESQFSIQTQGGDGYGTSIWLGDSFLDSWVGAGDESQYTQNLTLSSLSHGKEYVITVLIDHMGNEESGPIYSNTVCDVQPSCLTLPEY